MPPKRVNIDPSDPRYQKIKSGIEQRRKEKQDRDSLMNDDLFDNPMIREARKQIPKEQQEKWAKMGEEMYNTVDFVDAEGKSQTIPEDMMEGAAYVIDSIKSGMHISYLEKNERDLLKEIYGSKWHERFGYTEQDINGIHTFPEQDILLELNKELHLAEENVEEDSAKIEES
jgi:hypothetical protein